MDVLMLCYRDEALREFPLGEHGLEVGRGAGCDIVVHDPGVLERHLLVTRRADHVVAHDLARKTSTKMEANRPLKLGRHHTLVRVPDVPTKPARSLAATEQILDAPGGDLPPQLSLVIGRSRDARRARLGGRPLTIGSATECDVVLHDRSVSRRHCRLEPTQRGYRVRDLGSSNGTFVEGVPVSLASVGAGSALRIGRTDLRLVPHGRPGDARRTGVIAQSDEMVDVLDLVERYARVSQPVLIQGETGSGKEVIARALHARGRNPDAPFVAVNAGGIAPSLVESELFGHERGAFTGASADRRGFFEQADGGTLFLDEIGELPLELQARLLRVLATKEVRRVGAERSVACDFRLVCATHRDVAGMVAMGGFREDLYFRINVLSLSVPPLRRRPEDLAPLAQQMLSEVAEEVGPRELSEGAITRLRCHHWPGNVRELRGIVAAAAIQSPAKVIGAEAIASALSRAGVHRQRLPTAHLQEVIDRYQGNLAAAARALGVPRTTLRDRLRAASREAG